MVTFEDQIEKGDIENITMAEKVLILIINNPRELFDDTESKS